MNLMKESHLLVPPSPRLDIVERGGLLALGMGLTLLFGSLFNIYQGHVIRHHHGFDLCWWIDFWIAKAPQKKCRRSE